MKEMFCNLVAVKSNPGSGPTRVTVTGTAHGETLASFRRRKVKNVVMVTLFALFIITRLCGQGNTTLESIKAKYVAERTDSNTQANFEIIVEPVSIFDSTNWHGVYAAFVMEKSDSLSNKRCIDYFVYYNNQLYFELYKRHLRTPRHKPNRIHKRLIREYGIDKIKVIEHYFYYRYPGQF